MNANELHVVFGATGGAGSAIVRELVVQNKRVRAVSRSGGDFGPGVETVKADAMDANQARAVAQGASVIYHAINVPYPEWHTVLIPLAQSLISAAAATNARLAVVDNLYMYGLVNGPMRDDSPVQPNSRKGELRARVADLLLEAHKTGKAQVVLGRAADFYGPNVRNALVNDGFFRSALAGKTVRWAGTLDEPHALMFIDDYARGMVALAQRPDAFGQAWILPHAPALTGREFSRITFKEAGKPPKIGVLSSGMVRLGGLFNATIREFGEMSYQFEQSFEVDSSRFEQTFGMSATPYRDGIRHTLHHLY